LPAGSLCPGALAELPGEVFWPVALPFGELALLPLFCAFAAVVTGGAASGVGVTAGAAELPFPFPLPLPCAPAVSAELVLVCGDASGVTGRRARRRGSRRSAGRRRGVAASGRGSRITRGARCGRVSVPVAVGAVRQSKRRRHEESGKGEEANRECEERATGAARARRRFARRRADCPQLLPIQNVPQKLPVCLSPPRRRVLIALHDRTPRPSDNQ